MNSKTLTVFTGYVNLSSTERREFIETLQEFEEEAPRNKVAIKSRFDPSAIKMELGPLEGGCPCCGR